jgi:hypothetical protein
MIPAAPACIANLATLLTYDRGIKFNNDKKNILTLVITILKLTKRLDVID